MNFNFHDEKFQVHPKQQSMYQTIVPLGSFVYVAHNISCLFNRTQIVGTFFSLFISSACTSDYKGFTANIYWSPSFRIVRIHKKQRCNDSVSVRYGGRKIMRWKRDDPSYPSFSPHFSWSSSSVLWVYFMQNRRSEPSDSHTFFGATAQVKHYYWPFHFLIESLCE